MNDNFQVQQYLDQGDQFLKEGQPIKALQILRKAIKTAPEDLNAHFLLGIALQKCSRLRLAFKEFEWLEKRGVNSELKRQMGWTKVMMGELEEGRRYLREAINMNLVNGWAYADLGMSYARVFDFDTALDWMERARHLTPDDDYILWNISQTKKFQKEFQKFSEREKQKLKKLKNDPEVQKQIIVQNMFSALQSEESIPEDMEEVKKELELMGLNPKFESFKAPGTKEEKEIIEYMKYHHKVEDVERKISSEELQKLREKLFDKNTSLEELKKILLVLAHQDTKEAMNLLKEYQKNPRPQLKSWVKLAKEECQIFISQQPGKITQIIHQIKKKI
jgi:tetratricopeptide (TPR) repeat protein